MSTDVPELLTPTSSEGEVQQWLRTLGLAASVQEVYEEYEGSDFLSLTLEDHRVQNISLLLTLFLSVGLCLSLPLPLSPCGSQSAE